MSKEAMAAFFKKAAEDKELQKKIIELAAEEGFDFTSEELSDTDLDTIAGGFTWKLAEPAVNPLIEDDRLAKGNPSA